MVTQQKKKKEEKRSKREVELDAKLLESIRRKAMEDMTDDESLSGLEQINAGWRMLYSYGFEGNELKKAWLCWLSGCHVWC